MSRKNCCSACERPAPALDEPTLPSLADSQLLFRLWFLVPSIGTMHLSSPSLFPIRFHLRHITEFFCNSVPVSAFAFEAMNLFMLFLSSSSLALTAFASVENSLTSSWRSKIHSHPEECQCYCDRDHSDREIVISSLRGGLLPSPALSGQVFPLPSWLPAKLRSPLLITWATSSLLGSSELLQWKQTAAEGRQRGYISSVVPRNQNVSTLFPVFSLKNTQQNLQEEFVSWRLRTHRR